MPEFVEAEAYRLTVEPLVGATIGAVEVLDQRVLRRGTDRAELESATTGADVVAVGRIGKVVLVDLSSDHTVGLTFGLRGRVALDGEGCRTDGTWRRLRLRPDHIRFRLTTAGGRVLELEDQLRLATVELDFDDDRLGVDIMTMDRASLTEALDGSRTAIKTRLMDQKRIAGIGNLIADEILYQGRIDPRRAADSLSDDERDRLWQAVRRTRRRLLERGGSHHGVLIQSGSRERGEPCPRCGVEIRRETVGGRTTYFCPSHQR